MNVNLAAVRTNSLAPAVRLFAIALLVLLAISWSNVFVVKVGLGGILSIAVWLVLGAFTRSSAPLARLVLGASTGLVAAATNVILRYAISIPGEIPGIDGDAGSSYWVVGAWRSLAYWPIVGAAACWLGGQYPRSTWRWIGLAVSVLALALVAFFVAGSSMDREWNGR